MHPTNGFVRRSAPILVALLLAACDDDAPTNAMSAVEAGPSSVVSPGFPIDVPVACTIGWPANGGTPCEVSLGIVAEVSPVYLDSLLIAAGFPREMSGVLVRRQQFYQQNQLPIPASPPMTIVLSKPVKGLLVQVVPWVTNRTARATFRLTEADGNVATYEVTRACTFVSSCRLRGSYTSDVGFTRIELSVPAGDHFGASITVGGVVETSNTGVALTLSSPEGRTMPSELPMDADACTIAPVVRERSYGVIARRASTGEPVANLPLTLSVGAIEGSGGHRAHVGARPLGSFSSTAQETTTQVTTDAEGRAQFRWFAPEVSGVSFVSVSATGASEVADTFTVGVALARMTPGRWVYANDGARHDDVWYAAPQMVSAASVLADSVHARWGQALGFGDMSLPLGGRFERAGDWTDAQHCSHRWGNALDLRHEALTDAQRNYIELRWRHLTGRRPIEHGGHYHLQTWREL